MRSSTCCNRRACRHGSATGCRCCPIRRESCWPPVTGSLPHGFPSGWPGIACDCTGSVIDPAGTGAHTWRMSSKAPPEATPVADFEASLDALEQLVEKMERGDMSLEESLAAYERGVGLYRRCQTALEQAELRVRLLSDPEDPAGAQAFPPAQDPDPDA